MAITKFNSNYATINWNVDTKDYEYKKPCDMTIGQTYTMHGMFITPDNGYGLGACIICDGFLLNAPASAVETIKAILEDKDTVEDIMAGKCGFKVKTFVPKKYKNKTGYALEFVEL